jgi:hypothetical protein
VKKKNNIDINYNICEYVCVCKAHKFIYMSTLKLQLLHKLLRNNNNDSQPSVKLLLIDSTFSTRETI